jgi:hypothetical protein
MHKIDIAAGVPDAVKCGRLQINYSVVEISKKMSGRADTINKKDHA